MVRQILALIGATILAIVFQSIVIGLLHYVHLVMQFVYSLLSPVFAATQIGHWLQQGVTLLGLTALIALLYYLLDRLVNRKLPFDLMNVVWVSWLILLVTMIFKP